MSLFSNSAPVDRSVEEGTVVQIDALGSICKVKTLRGQMLQDVQWILPIGGSSRGSDRVTPVMGDKVILSYGLGYPVIIGFLPRPQISENTNSINVGSDSTVVDTGSYGPGGGGTAPDQNKPRDIVGGDRVITSIGGAMLALLRGGTAVLRANRGAEVLLSNLNSFVRVVSRNWAHFTDLSSDVIRNFNGRVYRYTGYSKSFTDNKIEDYKLHYYYGDVKAAETIKTNYDLYTGTPSTDAILFKEQITRTTPSPLEFMKRTLNDTGEEEVIIRNDTHFTRITSTAEQIQITWNDQNVITLNETAIHAVHKDGADFIIDADGIRGTFSDGEVNLESGDVTVSFGGSTAVLTSSDITLTNGSGSALVSSSQTKIANSGHQVLVTAGGVAIS